MMGSMLIGGFIATIVWWAIIWGKGLFWFQQKDELDKKKEKVKE